MALTSVPGEVEAEDGGAVVAQVLQGLQVLLQFPVGQLGLQERRQAAEDQGVEGGWPGTQRAVPGVPTQSHQPPPAPLGMACGYPTYNKPVPPPKQCKAPCRLRGLSPAGVWGAHRPLPLSPSGHLRVSKEKLLGAKTLGEECQAFPSFPVELQEEDRGLSPAQVLSQC